MEETFVLAELESWHVMDGWSHLKNILVLTWLWSHLQILPEAMVAKVVAHSRKVAFVDAAVAVELKEIGKSKSIVFIAVEFQDDADARIRQVASLASAALDKVCNLRLAHEGEATLVLDRILIEDLSEDVNRTCVEVSFLIVEQWVL